MDFRGCLIIQGLMQPFVIIKGQVVTQIAARLPRSSIIFAIDFFILDSASQAFIEDVVQSPSSPIHTDVDLSPLQTLGVFWAGELTGLIAFPDFRFSFFEGAIHGAEHKGDFKGLIQLPAEDEARKPVQDRHQVQLTACQANIGDINV
jgi:hypothetical protein